MASWSGSIKRAMDRVHTTWAGIIKHLLDRTSPNIIFIWSGKVILGEANQINIILVSVLSNKCLIFLLIILISKHVLFRLMQKYLSPVINCLLCCMKWYSWGVIFSLHRIRTRLHRIRTVVRFSFCLTMSVVSLTSFLTRM